MSQPLNKGLTSLEAAAMYLSDGKTTDPSIAAVMASNAPVIGEDDIKLDRQQKAHLVEMMGFDFKIKITPTKIHVSNVGKPHFSAYTRLTQGDLAPDGMIMNMDTVNRLVDACERLKIKHDKATAT